MVCSNKCLDETQHTNVCTWTEPPPAPSSSSPKNETFLPKKLNYSHSQQTQRQSKLQQGGGNNKKKKDQAFLSEQQLSSCTWSPAAIFNKMLLFNIVYCQQPVVIFSWTMHTQASKSLSLSLKLGRIFQYLSRTPQWHYLTPPLLSYLSDNIP